MAAVGARRLHLAALGAVVGGPGSGLVCGLMGWRGGAPVLNVGGAADGSGSVAVGCDRVGGRWWFVLADSGEGVVPVDEVEGAPAVLAGLLRRVAGQEARA